jgi:hypothetical protein
VRTHWRRELSEAKIIIAGLERVVKELIFAVIIVTFLAEIPGFCLFKEIAVRNTR